MKKNLQIWTFIGIFVLFWGLVYSINSQNEGFRIVKNSPQQVKVHDECKKIFNNSDMDVFIPTRSLEEWNSVKNNSYAQHLNFSNCDELPPTISASHELIWYFQDPNYIDSYWTIKNKYNLKISVTDDVELSSVKISYKNKTSGSWDLLHSELSLSWKKEITIPLLEEREELYRDNPDRNFHYKYRVQALDASGKEGLSEFDVSIPDPRPDSIWFGKIPSFRSCDSWYEAVAHTISIKNPQEVVRVLSNTYHPDFIGWNYYEVSWILDRCRPQSLKGGDFEGAIIQIWKNWYYFKQGFSKWVDE